MALSKLNLTFYADTPASRVSDNTSFRLNQSASYLYAIEYPYEISRVFSRPSGYSIGSNAIGISLLGSSNNVLEAVNMITAFTPYVINSVEKKQTSQRSRYYISGTLAAGATRKEGKQP